MKTVVAVLALAASFAHALGPQKPIQKMTCGEAIAYVAEYKSFWWQTAKDGVIPIYPIIALHETLNCLGKTAPQYILVPTLDQHDCHVGYNCKPI